METFVSSEKLQATKITVAGEDGKQTLFVYGLSSQAILNAINQAFNKGNANVATEKPRRKRRLNAAPVEEGTVA